MDLSFRKNRYFENEFSSIFRVFANHILTIISNILNNQNLTNYILVIKFSMQNF